MLICVLSAHLARTKAHARATNRFSCLFYFSIHRCPFFRIVRLLHHSSYSSSSFLFLFDRSKRLIWTQRSSRRRACSERGRTMHAASRRGVGATPGGIMSLSSSRPNHSIYLLSSFDSCSLVDFDSPASSWESLVFEQLRICDISSKLLTYIFSTIFSISVI